MVFKSNSITHSTQLPMKYAYSITDARTRRHRPKNSMLLMQSKSNLSRTEL